MLDRVVLHLGTEKTGSTSIQSNLASNRAQLQELGIIVPKTGASPESAWHIGLAAAFCDVRRLLDLGRRFGISDADGQQAFRKQFEEDLRAEIAEAPSPNAIVLSSEHLHSRLVSQDAVAELASFLSTVAERVDCIVYLTRQDRLAISKASTSVRGGAEIPTTVLPIVAADKQVVDPFYDYLDLWQRYRNAFADFGSVTVRPLRRDGAGVQDVVDDFFSLIGVEAAAFERQPKRNEGLQLSAAGLDAFAHVTERYGRLANDFASDNVFQYLASIAPGGGYRSKVSRAAAMAFYDDFSDSNRRLASACGLGGELFDLEFSEYSEQVATQPEHDRDVCGLLVDLLGHVAEESVQSRRSLQVVGTAITTRSPRGRKAHSAGRLVPLLDVDVKPRFDGAELESGVWFSDGWHDAEQWGRWTSSHEATLFFIVSNREVPRLLQIDLETTRPSGADTHPQFAVGAGARHAVSSEPTLTVEVPSGFPLVRVTIRSATMICPAHHTASKDTRSLGVGLTGIAFRWSEG